jgi:transcription elongation factor GreA
MKQKTSEKITYNTQKGLDKLQTELMILRTEKRQEISEYLQETMGGIDDNEYLLVLEKQAFVEGRIQQLETLLRNVKVIEQGQNKSGVVDLGSTVMLRDHHMESETYTITGSAEANPQKGMISNVSPLGKALLGKKVGDDIEIKTPSGLLNFKICAIR